MLDIPNPDGLPLMFSLSDISYLLVLVERSLFVSGHEILSILEIGLWLKFSLGGRLSCLIPKGTTYPEVDGDNLSC